MPLVPLGPGPDPEAGSGRWTVEHEGRAFLVLAHEGRLVVTDALCPHKQLPLAEGVVRDGALVCPGHWYAFDLGTGACRTTGDVRLPTYPVLERAGAAYAEVPDAELPLSWSERLRAHAREG